MNHLAIPDNVLFEEFTRFSRVVLQRLAACTGGQGFANTTDIGIEFTEEGWQDRIETKASTISFWKSYLDDQWWQSLDAIQISELFVTAGILESPRIFDSNNKRITTPSSEMIASSIAPQIIKPILSTAASERSTSISENTLRDVFDRYLKFWRTTEFDCRIIAPLLNFDMELDTFEICDNLAICRLDKADKTFIYSHLGELDGLLTAHTLSKTRFALTAKTTRTKYKDINLQPWIDAVRHCVTAMRLLGMSSTGAPRVICLNYEPLLGPGGKTSFLDDLAVPIRHNYLAQEVHLQTLTALFKTISAVFKRKNAGGLRLSLNRFNLSFSRQRSEDSLLDLVIAMEASLQHGKRSGNNSQHAAQRAAALLADLTNDPEQVAQRIKVCAAVRNNIVHQGLPLGEIELPQPAKFLRPKVNTTFDIHTMAQQTARELLLAYLHRMKTGRELSQINDELDRNMYKGLKCLQQQQTKCHKS